SGGLGRGLGNGLGLAGKLPPPSLHFVRHVSRNTSTATPLSRRVAAQFAHAILSCVATQIAQSIDSTLARTAALMMHRRTHFQSRRPVGSTAFTGSSLA